MNQIIEEVGEYDLELHLLFVDFHKAFDSVGHHDVWEAMYIYKRACPDEVVEVLKNLYGGAEACLNI